MNWKMVAAGVGIAVVAAVVVGIATMPETTTPTNKAQEARVRVAHTSPDAPAVDVWVDGTRAFSDVEFQDITDYAALPAGTYNVQVVPAGATVPVVIDADLTLNAGTDYTVVAVGELAAIQPLVLIDDQEARAEDAHVRFVHSSPDAPAVDIAVKDGPVLISDVSFAESADYISVAAGTYDLEVRIAGTATVALELNGLTFEGGQVYTAYAVGWAADGSLTAILSLEPSQ